MEGPITITYTTTDHEHQEVEHFDFLVVARDPRLLNLTSRSSTENDVCNALHSFTFQTSQFRVNLPYNFDQSAGGGEGSDLQKYTVKFNMENVFARNGTIYGFRDEVMARTHSVSDNGVTYLNAYQLLPTALIDSDEAAVQASLNAKRDEAIENSEDN